jgi:glycine betaine/proline transport system ATP-binding protein
VLENVAFGLEIRGLSRAERERKAEELLEMVGLSGWAQRSIENLSGGMKQRVGIARALCNEPEILLMDEPFSALDPLVRSDMQFELMEIQKKLEKTIVFITHDINEAFKLGDTVAIMRDGRIEQMDTPEQMSRNPANEYVRNFIQNADKSRVLMVRHVMQKPSCVVRVTDSLAHAVQQMRVNGVSSAYVVGQHLRMLGVVTIEDAIRVIRAGGGILADILITDVPKTREDLLISDILPQAAAARFPLAVIDCDGGLEGIVTKASVLASML